MSFVCFALSKVCTETMKIVSIIYKKWTNHISLKFHLNQSGTSFQSTNHMMYGYRYKKCNRHNFLSFWSILCSFTPLTTQEIKILKKWKKTLEIALFYINTWIHEYINLHKFIRTINDNHMMYGSWDMKHDRQNFWSFWAISYTFTPLTTPKIKIL